ncbi:MAG: SDR family oxidoreductase [Candidatus Omnitrophica bacterium]|nr:SDR family oxidoreductase [Candidatus Omnitrophota bacterium]
MKKIVVTGALGHIGSYLIRELPGMFPETEIWMIDNLSTERYASLFNLPENGKYRFFEEDITTADLERRFDGADAVIHLAAVTNAAESFKDPEKVESVNVNGTERVAEACIRTDSRLIFASTTSVYGKSESLVDENCPVDHLKPQSPYAESKIVGERHLRELASFENIRFVICRFGTIYGVSPGMRFHTIINKFCWLAAQGKMLTVWKTAWDQVRPYLDLQDAGRALEFILRKDLFNQEVYNIVTLNSTPKDIVACISKEVPEVHFEMVQSEIMNQLSYHVSNKKFTDLGFHFTGDLEGGISETLDWLKNSQSLGSGLLKKDL